MEAALKGKRRVVAFLLLFTVGMGLRCFHTVRSALWEDEAESAINALTILQTGLPRSEYLGIPIFENTLVTPWPESEEYEFKDSSYSEKGLAVYHGWLPLYSIAASMALFDLKPDTPASPPKARYGTAELLYRGFVPRVPALIFSAILLILLFRWGPSLIGEEATWAALTITAISDPAVYFGSQARYYSPTLLFTFMCGLLIWRFIHHPRMSIAAGLGATLAMLFHTHIVSCAIGVVLAGCSFPFSADRRRAFYGLLLSGAILAAAALPWIWYTGFLEHASGLPKALALLNMPYDLWDYPARTFPKIIPLALVVLLVVVAFLGRSRLPAAFFAPVLPYVPAVAYITVWAFFGYLVFVLTVPAASYFFERIKFLLLVEYILLTAIAFALCARYLKLRRQVLGACVLTVLFLAASGQTYFQRLRNLSLVKASQYDAALELLQETSFEEGTKLYSSPNAHLVLTYYSGLPVQSIAPVRKEFLRNYDKPIFFITPMERFLPPRAMVLAGLRRNGLEPTAAELQEHREVLSDYLAAESLRDTIGAEVEAPLPSTISPELLHEARRYQARMLAKSNRIFQQVLALRDQDVATHEDWWQVFFYRFVDPESRRRKRANFAELLPTARVRLLRSCNLLRYDFCVVYEFHPALTMASDSRAGAPPDAEQQSPEIAATSFTAGGEG